MGLCPAVELQPLSQQGCLCHRFLGSICAVTQIGFVRTVHFMTWFDWAKKKLAAWQAVGAVYPDGANFTPRAVQALVLAGKEARQLNHNFVGTEHVLLGLLRLNKGVTTTVLQRLGVDLVKLREAVAELVPGAPAAAGLPGTPYTPRMKKVLLLAQRQARSLHHTYVGTEHLLLGLLEEGDGFAARALRKCKLDLEQVRREILKELDPNISPDDQRPG